MSLIDDIKIKIQSTKNYCSLDKSIKLFLKENYYGKTLGQQIYHFFNGNSMVLCPECNTECKWLNTKRSYSAYCSRKCYNLSKLAKENKKQHFIEKYGVDNPAKLSFVKEKIKNTNLKKYGKIHHMQNDEIKENKKQHFIEKYGVDNPAKLSFIKEKIKNTNLKKYGKIHHMQNDEIKEKVFNTNIKKYGVKSPIQNCEIYEKIIKTNIDRYGYSHYSYRNFNNETYNVLTDKRIMQENFNNFGGNFQKFADEYTLNISTLHKKTISMGIRSPYKTGIVAYLENKYKLYNLKLNCRKTIKPQELDIVFLDHKLALEINGVYWHSIERGKDKTYHINKIVKTSEKGIKLIMIWDFMWENLSYRNKYIELIDLLLNNNNVEDYINKNYGNILPMELFGWVKPYKYLVEPTISYYKNLSYWNAGYKVI